MNKLPILFLLFFVTWVILPIDFSHAAETSPMVTVEAEGSGDTKIAALKDAWTNAVRKAAGMYLASRTEVLNDDLTEQIAAYSRGQINSFEIISENRLEGLYNLKIRAKVDRDVLQEMAASGTGQTLKIDGASLAAQAESASGRNKDADEVMKLTGLMDFQGCLEYASSLVKQDIRGEQVLFVRHELKMNLDRFKNQAKEMEKLLTRIADSKESFALNSSKAREAFKIISQKTYDIVFDWNGDGWDSRFLYKADKPVNFLVLFYPFMALREPSYGDQLQSMEMGTGSFNVQNTEPAIYFRDRGLELRDRICLATNPVQAQCFALNEKLFDNFFNSIKNYSVQFQVARDKEFNDLIDSTGDISLSLAAKDRNPSNKHILFSPMLNTPRYSNHTIFTMGEYCVLICYQKLDLTPEELLNLKDLSTRYVMK